MAWEVQALRLKAMKVRILTTLRAAKRVKHKAMRSAIVLIMLTLVTRIVDKHDLNPGCAPSDGRDEVHDV